MLKQMVFQQSDIHFLCWKHSSTKTKVSIQVRKCYPKLRPCPNVARRLPLESINYANALPALIGHTLKFISLIKRRAEVLIS